jgi:hypothetical protein
MIQNVFWPSRKVTFIRNCQILLKLEFFQQIFEKYSNIKFHENSSSWNRVVLFGRKDRRTDIHDEANSHFQQFCEHA